MSLKAKEGQKLEQLAASAERFLEARGKKNLAKGKVEDQSFEDGLGRLHVNKSGPTGSSQCFLCDKTGHRVADCWRSMKTTQNTNCWTCGKPKHKANNCSSKAKGYSQILFMLSLGHPEVPMEDGPYVFLQNDSKISVVNTALGRPPTFLAKEMPVVEGLVGNKRASVLRDSGCNTIVVRRVVLDDQLMGTTNPIFLLDTFG